LARALNSVLRQTVPVHEVIVVDDGSTDGTAELVQDAMRRDSRIRYLWQQNAGATVARNTGLDAVTGEVVGFQDSDDQWAQTFVEVLLPMVGRNTVAFGSHRFWTDDRQNVIPPRYVPRPRRTIRRTNLFPTQTALLDASLLRATRFDPQLRRFQDWDLWLSLIERTDARMVHVPVVVVDKYLLPDSIGSGSPSVRDASLRRILRRHWRLFATDPVALGRTVARGVIRPAVGRLTSSGPRQARPRRVTP
jgi:glycosyltransferase involved in cell wall biosynthesis